jgi:uncharacterized protein YdhG (YjbR/CyaY superfamily)
MGKFATVDEYLAAQPEQVRARLIRIGELIVAAVPTAVPFISYDIIGWFDGEKKLKHLLLYVAGWKQHIGMYPVPSGITELDELTAPFRSTKDTLKLMHADEIPSQMISAIVKFRAPAS